jgi:pimeloyl-ACP methyl ester carboxylesterase
MELNIDGLSLYYEIYGTGIPIVMIHGFGPDHRILKGCMEPIFKSKKGYQRIYFDLPGMGRTKAVNWIHNADDMLKLILDFIQNIIPEQKFLIVGESYGAYLARGLIEKKGYDIYGASFICPAIIMDRSKRILPRFHVILRDSEFLSSLSPQEKKEFEEMHVIQTKTIWERYKDEVDSGLRLADEKFLTKYYNKGYSFTFDRELINQKFEKPSLFILGRQDNAVGYHDAYNIIENYPRASFVILDKAGHNLQIEQESIFNVLVEEWLERVTEFT